MSKTLVKIANGDNNDIEIRIWWCTACDEPHQDGGKWQFNGDLESPTFSPSFLLSRPANPDANQAAYICHSFVRDGRIEYLSDCTHDYAGQTVDMIEGRY